MKKKTKIILLIIIAISLFKTIESFYTDFINERSFNVNDIIDNYYALIENKTDLLDNKRMKLLDKTEALDLKQVMSYPLEYQSKANEIDWDYRITFNYIDEPCSNCYDEIIVLINENEIVINDKLYIPEDEKNIQFIKNQIVEYYENDEFGEYIPAENK